MADLGFCGNCKILALGVLTMETGAVVCKACQLGGSGGMPIQENVGFRIFWDHFWCNLEAIAIAIPSRSISIWMAETAQLWAFQFMASAKIMMLSWQLLRTCVQPKRGLPQQPKKPPESATDYMLCLEWKTMSMHVEYVACILYSCTHITDTDKAEPVEAFL